MPPGRANARPMTGSASNPESRDSPMRNCASAVWCYAPSRNDRHAPAFSRRRLRPSYCFRFALGTEEGAGKAGCPPHPWSACNKKHAAEPQVQADQPAFPAQWFYGLYVLSPVTSLVATVACGSYPASLAPASERQDHTTSPSAATSFVRALFARLTLPRPSHPVPNVRDDRDTPLLWTGTAETVSLIWGKREAEYFCAKGWTGFRARRFFCPSGKSI